MTVKWLLSMSTKPRRNSPDCWHRSKRVKKSLSLVAVNLSYGSLPASPRASGSPMSSRERSWRRRKVCIQNYPKGGSTNREVTARRLNDPVGQCPVVSRSALLSIQPQRGSARRRPSPWRASGIPSRLSIGILKDGAKAQFSARCGLPNCPLLVAIIQTSQKGKPCFWDT